VELPPGPTCQRESPRVYVGQAGQGSSALDAEVFAHGACPPRGAASAEGKNLTARSRVSSMERRRRPRERVPGEADRWPPHVGTGFAVWAARE
jgi:hypothetical protein